MAVYAITLAFCNPEILLRSIEAFYRTRSAAFDLNQHFIVDQHYPLHREAMESTLQGLSERFPVTILNPGRNLGLHHGFNWAMTHIPPHNENDVVIGYDGDSLPVTAEWDEALFRAVRASGLPNGERVVWASLANPRTVSDVVARGFDSFGVTAGELKIWLARTAITNSVCAWQIDWLRSVGGLTEPRAFYGHLESAMFDQLKPGQRWAVLPEFGESDSLRDMHDREYTAYKWHHAHTNRWPGTFESFIEAGCPELDSSPLEIP